MSVLYLTEEDVRSLLTPRLALEAVEESFRQLADHRAMNVPRRRAKAAGITLHTLSAAADYLQMVGCKVYTTTRTAAQFRVLLFDGASGELVAMVEADLLGQLRTAATTAVAIQWMADMGASELGLFGTGLQARSQLVAACEARTIHRAFVYSRKESRREAFADEMSAELNIEVVPVDRPQEAAEDLPIVITATTSAEPVFDGRDLSEGALVCAVGSNWLSKAEIDTHTIRRADNIVCDSIEACRLESGDFVAALEAGVFDWGRAVELADVVAGTAVGRSRRESVCLFDSVGLALEDVALATKAVDLARARGVGRTLPI
jgi:alanine dehydrogenase